MNYYANRGGNSNVQGYEIGEDFITVILKNHPKLILIATGQQELHMLKQ